MKNISIYILMLLVSTVVSCDDYLQGEGPVESRTLSLGEIHSLSLEGNDHVLIERGPVQEITVTGHSNIINLLDHHVHNGHWDIRLINRYAKRDHLTIRLVLPELEAIAVNGSGEILVDDLFETGVFQAGVAGSGKISVAVNSDEFYSDIAGSGTIEVSGTAGEQHVSISGSGDYAGFDLHSASADIFIAGSGSARVQVSDFLEADVTGSGQIRYRGNPVTDIRVTGSGWVRKD